jgi:hypothetical protein
MDMGTGLDDDISALASVAAVRTAFGYVFLSSKRATAVAAVARL